MTEPATVEGEPAEARVTGRPWAARRRLAAEDLAWLSLPLAALVLAAALAWLAPPLSHLQHAPARDVFRVWQLLIAPEPLEEARSILALAMPFLLGTIVLAAGSREPSRRRVDLPVILIQAVAAGLLVFAVVNQTTAGPLLPPHYFKPLLIGVPNMIAGVCIGLLLTALIAWAPAPRVPATLRPAVGWLAARGWVALVIAVAATVLWLLPAVVTDSTVTLSGRFAQGHVPVQAEDYFAVVNGRTPLVDYIALYVNLLPLALAPILAAFDSSITSFSIAMCVLSTFAMLAVFAAFREVTRRAWLALALYVPWLALSLIPWNQVGAIREYDGIYYGVLPGRYLGPFVLAWLCALSIRRRIPTWALFGLAGLVVLNNAEFGVGAVIGLAVAAASSWDRELPFRRRAASLLVEAVAGLLGALALVCVVTLVRAGSLPDPSLLTYWDRLFLNSSYGLQRMPTLGLHWALYATYAAALLTAAVRYVRAEPDRALTALLAWSGTFGLATGMYFVGRSSQYQLMLLFPAWGFSLGLLVWTAAVSLRSARVDRRRLSRLLLPACAALIGYGVMIAAIDRFPSPRAQIDRISQEGQLLSLAAEERYVATQTRPGEKILLIGAALDHRVAERAGVENVSPLDGVITLISPREANRAVDALENAGGSQVFETVSAQPPGQLAFDVPEFATILRERGYRIVGEDPSLHMRLWRPVAG
jgi:hypothetical protein